MRILWYSSSPECRTAYGIVTREIVRRLKAVGHFVRIATKHEYLKWEERDGLEISDGTDIYFVNRMIEDEGFDYLISFCELWDLYGKRPFPKDKWVAYAPTNTEQMPMSLKEELKLTGIRIAMTQFGHEQILREGFDCLYAPHGLNTQTFRPDAKAREEMRLELGLSEGHFLIGSLGVNYPDDVKGFIKLLQAFKLFHEEHDEARLFLCTFANERGVYARHNLSAVVQSLGLTDWVSWPNQMDYHLGRLTDDDLRKIYNSFDVFCLPTKGESFGLPLLEAQACGVPVIVTDVASGREMCKAGWLIETDPHDQIWSSLTSTWYPNPHPREIVRRLREAHAAWLAPSAIGRLKRQARVGAEAYDWDRVWPKYWEPIFKTLGDRLRA